MLPSYVAPGLERHLFSVRVVSEHGIVTVFNRDFQRLEARSVVLRLNQSVNRHRGLYVLSVKVDGQASPEPGRALTAKLDEELRHQRLGHIGGKHLNDYRKADGDGVKFEGTLPPCSVCALRKSKQLVHTKSADYYVMMPSQLVLRQFHEADLACCSRCSRTISVCLQNHELLHQVEVARPCQVQERCPHHSTDFRPVGGGSDGFTSQARAHGQRSRNTLVRTLVSIALVRESNTSSPLRTPPNCSVCPNTTTAPWRL